MKACVCVVRFLSLLYRIEILINFARYSLDVRPEMRHHFGVEQNVSRPSSLVSEHCRDLKCAKSWKDVVQVTCDILIVYEIAVNLLLRPLLWNLIE